MNKHDERPAERDSNKSIRSMTVALVCTGGEDATSLIKTCPPRLSATPVSSSQPPAFASPLETRISQSAARPSGERPEKAQTYPS